MQAGTIRGGSRRFSPHAPLAVGFALLCTISSARADAADARVSLRWSAPCQADVECPAGQQCEAGTCQAANPPAFMTNADCAAGQDCVGGACQAANPACMSNGDCS